MDTNQLVIAHEQFKQAHRAMILAVRALQRSGGKFDVTIKDIKETIGDLSLAIEQMENHFNPQ
jgi:hypothetical protein